jgi:septal ring factor EnvC (AmiA/AmiB activator)
MQDNQRRLEGIRRERSEVEQELERLRTQAHSISDEIANIERQKSSTNRIVNELDRQITGLSGQIDQITVDLLIAQDALLEKRAVLERRLVDIYKRGSLYSWQVLFAAESFALQVPLSGQPPGPSADQRHAQAAGPCGAAAAAAGRFTRGAGAAPARAHR